MVLRLDNEQPAPYPDDSEEPRDVGGGGGYLCAGDGRAARLDAGQRQEEGRTAPRPPATDLQQGEILRGEPTCPVFL